MQLTIKVPELDNKEFNFSDSTKNIKLITKLMKKSFEAQVQAEQESDEKLPDFSKMTDEELDQYNLDNTKKSIKALGEQLKTIDELIDTFAQIFKLNKKQASVLEDLSFQSLGELTVHVSTRLNNPDMTEDDYWEIRNTDTAKKLQPEKGSQTTKTN
ncbi:phage tail tube assembly chaperone [Oenococcus alcoholitolerans]|uniref:phage tail tube assembly chaperone n=1 Tax=Oenococcus alcoholitolerans TaxID=931074 RepID=UPI003F6EDF86